jgi:hypothetical protein
VGGLHQTTELRQGGPLVVLDSDDLDGSLSAVRAAGGTVLKEPFSFPGGRRFHFTLRGHRARIAGNPRAPRSGGSRLGTRSAPVGLNRIEATVRGDTLSPAMSADPP